jgi:hypothetical protein
LAINGITHSFEDVSIIIMGMKIGGIESCDYDDSEDDPEAVYDQGSREPVGMGLGDTQLVDITLEMREDAFTEFAAPAKAVGKSVRDYWPFPIVVAYADKEQDGVFVASKQSALHMDTLDQCKVVSISKPNKRGDKKLIRTFKLKGLKVA